MENIPLAEKLRPKKLSDFVGQEDLVGKDGVIRQLIGNAKKTNFFPSIIFWGPPGSGKTTLARIIANELTREFYEFSAVNTKTKEIEEVIKNAKGSPLLTSKGPIIFLDEIHRFNKAQQDKLLPHVEKGSITLIGATTENPSFEVIGPLLSRCRVVVFHQLEKDNIVKIINNTLAKNPNIKIS